MTRKQLAKELRQRLIDKGQVEKKFIDIADDDRIINAYTTCSCCDTKILDDDDLKISIEVSSDVDDFLNITDKYAEAIHRQQGSDDSEYDLPKYVACLGSYYKKNPSIIVRQSLLLIDLSTDEAVVTNEYFSKDKNQNKIFEDLAKMMTDYGKNNVKPMQMHSTKMIKCNCGCGKYLDDMMTRSDYISMLKSQ